MKAKLAAEERAYEAAATKLEKKRLGLEAEIHALNEDRATHRAKVDAALKAASA